LHIWNSRLLKLLWNNRDLRKCLLGLERLFSKLLRYLSLVNVLRVTYLWIGLLVLCGHKIYKINN